MSKGAARNRKTISLASPAMPLLLSSAWTIGANRKSTLRAFTSAEASARSRPPPPSTRQPAVTYSSGGRLRASRFFAMPASPAIPLLPGGHPQQHPRRCAESARLSYRPAVYPTPDRAWGHYRAQAPNPLLPAAGGPVRCGWLTATQEPGRRVGSGLPGRAVRSHRQLRYVFARPSPGDQCLAPASGGPLPAWAPALSCLPDPPVIDHTRTATTFATDRAVTSSNAGLTNGEPARELDYRLCCRPWTMRISRTPPSTWTLPSATEPCLRENACARGFGSATHSATD